MGDRYYQDQQKLTLNLEDLDFLEYLNDEKRSTEVEVMGSGSVPMKSYPGTHDWAFETINFFGYFVCRMDAARISMEIGWKAGLNQAITENNQWPDIEYEEADHLKQEIWASARRYFTMRDDETAEPSRI